MRKNGHHEERERAREGERKINNDDYYCFTILNFRACIAVGRFLTSFYIHASSLQLQSHTRESEKERADDRMIGNAQ